MTELSGIEALLRHTPLFGTLDGPVLATLGGRMRERTYNNGQLIFGRGDEGRDVHVLVSGRVRLSVLSTEGRELSFHHAIPGEVFGEIAVLDGGPRTADASAVGLVTTLALARPDLFALMKAHPQVWIAVIEGLCRRLRDADRQLEAVALHRVEVRLARYLLDRAQVRAAAAGASRPAGWIGIELGMSQGELAMLIGATRPKVNGALALLEEREAIRRRGEAIECDLAGLAAIADNA